RNCTCGLSTALTISSASAADVKKYFGFSSGSIVSNNRRTGAPAIFLPSTTFAAALSPSMQLSCWASRDKPGTIFPDIRMTLGHSSFSMAISVSRRSVSIASLSEGLQTPCFTPAVTSKVMPNLLRAAFVRPNSSGFQCAYSPTSSTFEYPASATFCRRCSNGRLRRIVHSITDNFIGRSRVLPPCGLFLSALPAPNNWPGFMDVKLTAAAARLAAKVRLFMVSMAPFWLRFFLSGTILHKRNSGIPGLVWLNAPFFDSSEESLELPNLRDCRRNHELTELELTELELTELELTELELTELELTELKLTELCPTGVFNSQTYLLTL